MFITINERVLNLQKIFDFLVNNKINLKYIHEGTDYVTNIGEKYPYEYNDITDLENLNYKDLPQIIYLSYPKPDPKPKWRKCLEIYGIVQQLDDGTIHEYCILDGIMHEIKQKKII